MIKSHLLIQLSKKVLGLVLVSVLCTTFWTTEASAFPHVLQEGETLAELAERYYGSVQKEILISTENGLRRASAPEHLEPGMVLEIPAPTFIRTIEGDTWKSLAANWLGNEKRAFLLASENGFQPWHEPELGQLVMIPHHLIWVAQGDESLSTLAYRYLGSTKHTYRLVLYNQLKDGKFEKGQVLLLPLAGLELSDEGKKAAMKAASHIAAEATAAAFTAQRQSKEELRRIQESLRSGHYVLALTSGVRLLSGGSPSRPVAAEIHRALLETYVALDILGLAKESCQKMLELAPDTQLDPLWTSPKMINACPQAARARKSDQ
ncbi:MAG: LysM peptidoglycan-binding domain-containing protein [Polyangiaceae bacterium]|nr:LysM peptidoglycan-binding domain-containing protein [Polyangiaceae bacterium]